MVANLLKGILIDGRYCYLTLISGTNVRMSLFLSTEYVSKSFLSTNIMCAREKHFLVTPLPVTYRKNDLCIEG